MKMGVLWRSVLPTKRCLPKNWLENAIARTEALNPELNAVVLTHYDEARAQIKAGLPEGPFAGVPFLLKNLGFELKGTATTHGCALFKTCAVADSPLVSAYKAAGLVIFGKTNAPEFGLSTSTEPRLYGATRNPWGNLSPGGSSGGAAAAVAAGLVPMAQASDGGGSIRIPAAACGLFGFKPSRGLMALPHKHAKQTWGGLATAHALTVSVRDSATLLSATSFFKDNPSPPPSLRIGFNARRFDGSLPERDVSEALLQAVEVCQNLGHHTEEVLPAVDTDAFTYHQMTLICTSLAILLEPFRGQEKFLEPVTALLARRGAAINHEQWEKARAFLQQTERQMLEFHKRYDVYMCPTLAARTLPLGVLHMDTKDYKGFMAAHRRFTPYTALFNMSGQPSMSVPFYTCGERANGSTSGEQKNAKLPFGIMFSAALGKDSLLFRLAPPARTSLSLGTSQKRLPQSQY